MSEAIKIKIIKGTEHVTLRAHNESILDVKRDAEKKERGYRSSSYRAEVVVSDRDNEGDLQEKSKVVRTFKDIELAVHWIRTFLIEREGDGDRVTGVLYEVKERRINDDGSPRTTLLPYFNWA